MTTPRVRSLVSLAMLTTITLGAGGCATASPRPADEPMAIEQPVTAFRFDNDARDYVHVYLIGIRREWMLARVAPGARATLRIPKDALAEIEGPMRLAVLVGERMSLNAVLEARAETTLPAPVGALLAQRWTFSPLLSRGDRLTPMPVGRAPLDIAHE
jgi:hypothetical protein